MKEETQGIDEVAEQLRRERELSDKIVNNSADLIFAFDRDLRITVWNTSMEQVTGVARQQAWGRLAQELPALTELAGSIEPYGRVLNGETLWLSEHALFVRALGVEAVLDVFLTPLRDAAGNVEGGVGVVHDITRYKRSAEELMAKEALLNEAQHLAHLGSWRLDVKRKMFAWSEEMYRIAGRERQAELPFGEVLSMVHPDDRQSVASAVDRVLRTREVFFHEYRVLRPDGAVRIVESRIVPIVQTNGGETIELRGTWLDVTERKRAEVNLRETNSKLEKTLAELKTAQEQVIQTEKIVALGTMAAGIAHELNNPLMGVMSYVNYARRDPSAPLVDRYLGKAEKELVRMGELIRSMLSFARPVGGEVSVVSVPERLKHALELLADDFNARGIEIVSALDEAIPPAYGRGPQLEQVFLNVILNARDAVTGRADRRIALAGRAEGEHVIVEIADTGPGVPQDIKNRIFDPFFTTKSPGQGTGLGLSVSRTVIEDMGGNLSLVSKEGEGARFRITLKRADLAASAGE